MKRIGFLDSFRGIAVLLVVFYHAYPRWSFKIQYAYDYSSVPLLGRGWIGVQLFFLVSGFVILLTLERCISFRQFMFKRWLRLFPAMLIATLLIYCTAPLLSGRPEGAPKLSSVIPGLLFLDREWIQLITHANTGVLEGVFWTLFVEVKYYLIFGSLYFLLGRGKALAILFVCFLSWCFFIVLSKFVAGNAIIEVLANITVYFSFKHFGWFATGSFAYLFYMYRNRLYMMYACTTGLVSVLALSLPDVQFLPELFLILFLFLATIYFDKLKTIITGKWFLFFGFISYPLYLVHQNAMVAMTVKLKQHFPNLPELFLPVIPMLVVVSFAFLIAKYGEPSIRNLLRDFLMKPSSQTKLNPEVAIDYKD